MYILLCKGAMFFCDLCMCCLVIWPSLGPFICNVFDFLCTKKSLQKALLNNPTRRMLKHYGASLSEVAKELMDTYNIIEMITSGASLSEVAKELMDTYNIIEMITSKNPTNGGPHKGGSTLLLLDGQAGKLSLALSAVAQHWEQMKLKGVLFIVDSCSWSDVSSEMSPFSGSCWSTSSLRCTWFAR